MARRRTAVYLALATADVALAAAGAGRARLLTKPLLMPALMVGQERDVRRALAAGWAGDVLLMRPGDAAFAGALGSFLTAHLAWIAALRRRDDVGALPGRLLPAATQVAAYAVVGRYLWPRTGSRLRLPVLTYGAALLAMSLTALDCRSRRVAAGGALFVASDTLLALQKFGGVRVPAGDALVMGTYAGAQVLLTARQDGGPG